MGYVARGLLCVLAIMCVYQGIFYVQGPDNRALKAILNPENLNAPALNVLVPFLGICYLNLGVFNLLAGVVFGINEACYVLIVSGLMFHVGSAILRSLMNEETANLYLTGVARRTNIIQYVLGAVYIVVGITVRCLALI